MINGLFPILRFSPWEYTPARLFCAKMIAAFSASSWVNPFSLILLQTPAHYIILNSHINLLSISRKYYWKLWRKKQRYFQFFFLKILLLFIALSAIFHLYRLFLLSYVSLCCLSFHQFRLDHTGRVHIRLFNQTCKELHAHHRNHLRLIVNSRKTWFTDSCIFWIIVPGNRYIFPVLEVRHAMPLSPLPLL